MSATPTVVDKVYMLSLKESYFYGYMPGLVYIVNELPDTEEAHIALKSYMYARCNFGDIGELSPYHNKYYEHYDSCMACGVPHDELEYFEKERGLPNIVTWTYGGIGRGDELFARRHYVKTRAFCGSISALQIMIDTLAFYLYCSKVQVSAKEFDELAHNFIKTNSNPLFKITLHGPECETAEPFSFYIADTHSKQSFTINISGLKGATYRDLFDELTRIFCTTNVEFESDAMLEYRQGPVQLVNHEWTLPRPWLLSWMRPNIVRR